MVTLAIGSRMTSSIFSMVILGAFFVRMVIANQVSSASFPNESFKKNLSSVDNELEKFRNILRSNQNSTFFSTNSTNNTLSDIDNCIDLTRRSIEELKADHSPDTNYTLKIDNLQANAINLQTSLIKLKEGRSTSSHIIDIGNAVFKRAQNLERLLNRFNSELDDLKEKVESEKAAKRLRGEIAADIKRDIIENLQNQIKMQQEEIGRFKEEAQIEKQRLLQEVEKIVADKIENIKHEIEDAQTKCVQKEWNITHTLHASLENHKKELQDEINRNKEQLVGEQKLIEQREKNNTNNVQVLLDNLKGHEKEIKNLAQSLNRSKHELETSRNACNENEVYNSQVSFFGALMRFPDQTEREEIKTYFYDRLYKQMKRTGCPNAWSLTQLRRLLKKEVLDKKPDYLDAQSLYDTLWKDAQETSVELISAAFLNENLWPMATQLSADLLFNGTRCDCIFEIYRKVIDRVWNKITIDDLLQKVATHLTYIEEAMAVHKAIVSKLMQTNTLTAASTKTIALYMKSQSEVSNYKNAPADWRSEYEALYKIVKNASQ